jgi:phosphoribosyl 1,2-cyclic phosphodiesterase
LQITPVPISHDVADPRAFILENDNHRLGIVTDLGMVTQLVRHSLKNLDALLLESNHSARMLREGPYPWRLKQRIAGRQGHLSTTRPGSFCGIWIPVPGWSIWRI